MSKYSRVIKDFSGGLSEAANDNMRDNELVEARNAVPGETYGMSRAFGTNIAYPQIKDLGDVILLIELPMGDGTARILAFTSSLEDISLMSIYDYDSASKEWSLVAGGLKKLLSWFIYANKLYWLDGSSYKVFNGETVADVEEDGKSNLWGKIISSVAVEQRGQRWFFATRDNEVIFSEVGYVNKFAGTNVINITSGKADNITALHEFNDGLLVFQQRSVYYLTGWDFSAGADIALSKINVSSGTKFPESVKTVENAVLYLGSNGLYRLYVPSYSESVASKNLSENKLSSRISHMEIMDCYAEVWDNVYYFTLKTSTGLEEYRYFLSSDAFWGPFTQGATCYAPGFLGEDYLYIGCSKGYVLRYDEDSAHYINLNNGEPAPIPMCIKTKGYDVCGAMVRLAKVKRALIVVRQFAQQSSNLNVQIKADYLDAAFNWEADFDESLVYAEGLWGEGYWGWKDVVTKEISVNRKAHRMQLTFYDETSDSPVVIFGIAFLYKMKKVKGSRDGITQAPVVYDD